MQSLFCIANERVINLLFYEDRVVKKLKNDEFNKKFLWVLEVGFLFSTHELSVSYKVSGLKKLENFEV